MKSRLSRMTLVCAAVVIPTIGCRQDATYVILQLRTDIPCADFRGAQVTIGEALSTEERPAVTATNRCEPGSGDIGSLVVVPSGDRDALFEVVVTAGLGRDPIDCRPPAYAPGCVVAKRRVRFSAHNALTLPILLSSGCNGIACGPTDTCERGVCRRADISAGDLGQ